MIRLPEERVGEVVLGHCIRKPQKYGRPAYYPTGTGQVKRVVEELFRRKG
jgi:hypothetical protein